MNMCAATIVATTFVDPGSPSGEGDARAQTDAPVFRTVVRSEEDDDSLEAQRALDRDTPGFGTAVDLRSRPDGRSDDGLADVLAAVPGAHVRSVGGLGQFSAVSLRGSSSQQVSLFTDGVPLGDSFGGLLNLADLPLVGVDEIRVYRGFVPARYGGATLGGAIDVHSSPRWGRRSMRLASGLGSFGARQLSAEASVPLPHALQLTTAVGYAGALGDFAFYDDASTPMFTGDDRNVRRRNNDYDRGLVQVRVDHERGPVRAHVQQWFVGRNSGIAGPIGAPSSASRLRTLGFRTTASIEHIAFGRPGGRLGAWAGFGVRRQRFVDPRAELGPGRNDQTLRSFDVYASPRWRTPLWRGAFLSVTADVRPEWIDVEEAAPQGLSSGDAKRRRLGAGVGVELEQFAWERRVKIVPVVRVDGIASRFAVPTGGGESDDAGRDRAEVGFSPRLGARVRLVGPLELRASGGRYFRAPTLLELFGDQGYTVGNEGLRAERGTTIDGGVVVDHRGDRLIAYAHAAGFATYSEDLINWVSAGRVSRAVNLSAANVHGLEASAQLRTADGRLQLDTHYTFTHATDQGPDPTFRGQPLPGRPRHDAFARITLRRAWLVRGVRLEPGVSSGMEVLAGTRLDPSGRFEVPARLLQSLGVQLHVARRVHWALEVRNLLDQRTGPVTFPVGSPRPVPVAIGDVLGFPLPGRALWTTFALDFGDLS